MMIADWHRDGDRPTRISTRLPQRLNKLRLSDEGMGIESNNFKVEDWLAAVKSWIREKHEGKFPMWETLQLDDSLTLVWGKYEIAELLTVCSSAAVHAFVDSLIHLPGDIRQRWSELSE